MKSILKVLYWIIVIGVMAYTSIFVSVEMRPIWFIVCVVYGVLARLVQLEFLK